MAAPTTASDSAHDRSRESGVPGALASRMLPPRTLTAVPDHLRELAQAIRPTSLAADRTLPVLEALAPLFPNGALQRGSMVQITGSGGTAVALAVAAGASRNGSWVGFVGAEMIGWAAAEQLGVDPRRSLVVTDVPVGSWANVTAALIDAVDVVVAAPTHGVRPADARRLAARARERGSAMIVVEPRIAWPVDADIALRSVNSSWHGLERGHGRLTARRMTIESIGRRAAAQLRQVDVWIPAEDGSVSLVDAGAGTISLAERRVTSRVDPAQRSRTAV